MGYRLENRDIDLLDDRSNKIGTGKRGDVYKYRGQALKIYPNDFDSCNVLDEKTARYLSNISTDRILLPRKLVYYNKNFSGYSLKLIDQKGAKKKIINAPSMELLYNVKLLEDDVLTLSNKKVLLNGVTPSNVLYNGDIYLTDPSRYSVFEIGDVESLENLNQYQLHLLITELILADMRKENFTSDIVGRVKSLFAEKDETEKCSCFLRDFLAGSRDVKQLIKKM